jgi:hypothetical protein
MSGARAAGIFWSSLHKTWRAQISVDAGDGKRKLRYLGSFVNAVDAALAYDQAAREHHKDKAQLNFPDLPPQPRAALNKLSRQGASQYRGKGNCGPDMIYPPCKDGWRCSFEPGDSYVPEPVPTKNQYRVGR